MGREDYSQGSELEEIFDLIEYDLIPRRLDHINYGMPDGREPIIRRGIKGAKMVISTMFGDEEAVAFFDVKLGFEIIRDGEIVYSDFGRSGILEDYKPKNK